MASPRPEHEDEESFSDEDENDYREDDRSFNSQEESLRSFEEDRSYRSGKGSNRSGEGSHHSGEGSYRSGKGSNRSGEGSYQSGEGSYRSGEGSYRSGEGSYRSGEGSYHSGEGSYRSGNGSIRSGEGSYRSGSYRSGEGSYRSGRGSYRSGEGSYRNGEESYRSGEGSYRSGGSYREGDSYRSGEGSYRTGQPEGSYREGDDSYQSGEGSYRDETSRRSGQSSGDGDDRPNSFRDDDGSFAEETFHSVKKSNGDDERSYDSQAERSYRSDERSYSGEEGSFRSDHHSFADDASFAGDDVDRSFADEDADRSFADEDGEGPFADDDGERSFADEDGERSFSDEEGELPFADDDGKRSFSDEDGERSFADEEGQRSFADDDGERSFADDDGEQSFFDEDGERSFADEEGERSFTEDDESDRQHGPERIGNAEEVKGYGQPLRPQHDNTQEPSQESFSSETNPTTSSLASNNADSFANDESVGSASESEAPSFAEEVDFSPYPKSPIKATQPPVVFENAVFENEEFGFNDETNKSRNPDATDFEGQPREVERDDFSVEESDQSHDSKKDDSRAFDNALFENSEFGKNDAAGAFGSSAVSQDKEPDAFESRFTEDTAPEIFQSSAFGQKEGNGDDAGLTFETNVFGEDEAAEKEAYEKRIKEAFANTLFGNSQNGDADAFQTDAFGLGDAADAFQDSAFSEDNKAINAFQDNSVTQNDANGAFGSGAFSENETAGTFENSASNKDDAMNAFDNFEFSQDKEVEKSESDESDIDGAMATVSDSFGGDEEGNDVVVCSSDNDGPVNDPDKKKDVFPGDAFEDPAPTVVTDVLASDGFGTDFSTDLSAEAQPTVDFNDGFGADFGEMKDETHGIDDQSQSSRSSSAEKKGSIALENEESLDESRGSAESDRSFNSSEASRSFHSSQHSRSQSIHSSGSKSYHSSEKPGENEASIRSGSHSFHSSHGSARSGSRSYHSSEASTSRSSRSGSRPHHSSERSRSLSRRDSNLSGLRSHHSSEQSRTQSPQDSARSGSRSYHSSQRSRSRSEHSGSRSYHSSGQSRSLSRRDSNLSGSRSYHSSERSKSQSPRDSVHSGSQSQDKDEISSKLEQEAKAVGKNDESENSEGSLMIGEVFGQPNELFEDFDVKKNKDDADQDHSQPSDMQESLRSQDDTKDERDGAPKKSEAQTSDDDSLGETKEASETEAEESIQLTISPVSQSKKSVEPEEDSIQLTISPVSQSKKSVEQDDPGQISEQIDSSKEEDEKKKKKKKKRRRRKQMKSPALLDLVANVNDAMLDLEEHVGDLTESKQANMETSAHRVLHGFDALLGIYLQLSDELELIKTFSKSKKKKDKEASMPVLALQSVLSFAETLDQLFDDLKPIILDCFEEEPDEEMDDMLYRLNSLVDLLCETTHRVGEKQEWNERAETTYVTLLELMDREALELQCYFEDVDMPEHGLSANIHEAWSATGHIEELRALQYADDPWLFRQICYEVMVSTDQWCPDTSMLMEICGIDPSLLEEEPDPEYLALEEDDLAPIPQAAEHVLDKVNGAPLPRSIVLASILRRILPPRAITDATLLDNFTSIRNTIRNPLGLSATNIVSISSVPELLNDPDALGVGGMGKTTLAAMVAEHPDVRRYFIDGVVWVYVGDQELNYSRYTQCLRELVAQLDFYQGVPLFAELLHVPGETLSKRRRREEGFMLYARETIAELLHDRSVLIILDDVCFEPDLDWFDFAPMPGESQDDLDSNCALLVTTRCRTLLPAADTVEVDMLDEADAITLLIQESGQLSHALMAESREARSVVRECANHPLAVKSVGRWLNLKHATAGVVSSVEEIHTEVIKSMDKILKGGDHTGTDMMYEILSMSLSPAINGEPTSIIKFCLAAFVIVFCDRQYISDFALTEPTPIIPMDMAELLFETLLEMNESSLLQEGSLFYAQKKEAAVLIPEALSALGVLKVITYSDAEEEENPEEEQKFLQVMHFIHHEYGEYLSIEEEALKELTKDAERQWNRALVEAYLSREPEWDLDLEDAGHSYALEMIISHMIRGNMYSAAADLLADKSFVRGRLLSLGRENSTRRHMKDSEMLFKKLRERRPKGSKLEPRNVMKQAYQALGSQLAMEDEEQSIEDSRIKDVEVARAHYEIGFSLAEKRCWDAAIAHWETSQELLVSALGTVEVVAGILYNIGVVYSEMNEYEQALDSLKQCLRIRGTIHGEEHILYAQTIQKIGDIFLGMSDYHEAMESYNWALDVMYIEPSHHRVEIGEILDNKGTIYYSKGEIEEALQCHQEALRSKQVDLGEDHSELAATYHHIGNCLSDQGNVDDAIVHFEEAIRLKELDPEGGAERDADVLTIEGILHNLEGNQEHGLECYEKSLQILVTKVPHRKEKVASLLHLIGCVYLMSGEQKKAMKLFEESLQARRKVLGFVHLDVASTLFNMAFLHQTRNRLDKALKCLEEALKIRKLRLPDSEKVAVTHEKIGSLSRAIGKTEKAKTAFSDALNIRKIIHGEQHEAVATVRQELGDLMDDLGDYTSAMDHYIAALDIRRTRLGLDDISVAETLYSMGYTLHNQDEPDRALVCFEEALNIRRYRLGEDSKEVGDTLNMMGFLKAKRGELDDALTLLWDALRIRKLQEDHVKVSETLKNIGNVHREKQEQELAVECYEECLRIRRAELGADHEKVADALIAMGNVQSDTGRTDEAMRSYQEALKIRTMVFGEHDESVAAVLQYMGTMEFRSGNHEKARDLLTEFIRIRRDNHSKNDGDYVNVLFMIGNIHKMQGNEEEAQLCWTEAYQVFQELGLAETNPQIAKVMNHLLKVENEEENSDQKKKSSGAAGGVFSILPGKIKAPKSEQDNKIPMGRKRRKGKGIQL